MDNKMIVLEGVDGSGKTTLAKQLATAYETLGYVTYSFHEGPPPANSNLFKYYLRKLMHFSYYDGVVIIDRFYLGESVYGPIARGHSRINEKQRLMLFNLVKELGGKQVLCQPTWLTVKENYARKILDANDVLKSFDKLWDAYQFYEELAEGQILYDYTATPDLNIGFNQLFARLEA